MLIRVLTVCYHHCTTTSPHTIGLHEGPPTDTGLIRACISSHFQLTIFFKPSSPLHRHTYLTPFPTPLLTLYKQINPHRQQHTFYACWQAHTLVLHSHILGSTTCVHTHAHALLSGPVGLLLCFDSQRAWAACGLAVWGGPDAAGLTPRRRNSWNTPGLSVLTFFNLICIRASLGANMFGEGVCIEGVRSEKQQHTDSTSPPLCFKHLYSCW